MVTEERASQLESQLTAAHGVLEEMRAVKTQLEAALVAAQARLHSQEASRRALAEHWQRHHARRRAAATIQRAWRQHARWRAQDVADRAQRVLLDTQAAVGALQQRQGAMQQAHAAELARLGRWMVAGGAQGLAGSAEALLRAFVGPKKELSRAGLAGGNSMLARLQRVRLHRRVVCAVWGDCCLAQASIATNASRATSPASSPRRA